jgi:hypothetical protein
MTGKIIRESLPLVVRCSGGCSIAVAAASTLVGGTFVSGASDESSAHDRQRPSQSKMTPLTQTMD